MTVHEEICSFHGLDVKLEQLHSDESWYSVNDVSSLLPRLTFFLFMFLFVSEIIVIRTSEHYCVFHLTFTFLISKPS